MTRSRSREYEFANAIRKPVESVFGLMPKGMARLLLRWFRWSEGSVGYGVRYLCVRRLAKSCGKKVLVFPGCMLHWLENCEIGENVTIHDFCYIDAIGGIRIGDHVRMAHGCSIISGQHRYDVPGKTIVESGYTAAPIAIGSDVWLGTGAVVLPGLTVGNGSVVGCNSVVTANVEAHTIVAGVPARMIRRRFDGSHASDSPRGTC